MTRQYAKPPLIEALGEFRFAPPHADAVPDQFHERIKSEFPTRHAQHVVEVEASFAQKAGISIDQRLARHQFHRADNSALVQLGPQALTINVLKPYPGWPHTKPLLLRMHRELEAVDGRLRLTSIALRYINRVAWSSTDTLVSYFGFYPQLPTQVPGVVEGFGMKVIVQCKEPTDSSLTFTLAQIPPNRGEAQAYALDLELVSKTAPEDVERWLDEAHDMVETAFESAITERARKELFGEVL